MHATEPEPAATGAETGATAGAESQAQAGAEAAAELLRLLREDAGEADYAALLARAPHLPPRLVEDALRVRDRLAAQSRREATLAALYETAGDLASTRDLEGVLQAIVRRARTLLGTDVAYLLLADPEHGDTYVRATDGISTEAFKTGRLALGTGLGGLVAETSLPYHTADYPNDERFAHSEYVDGIIRSEGLIAIQGVPLKFGERVFGVLFVANRRVRPFSSQEVDVLISLAAHAALALENATLFEEVQRTVEQLTEANALVSAHSAAVERASDLHGRLTAMVLDGGTMADVARTLAEVLVGSILVLDAQGRVTAAAGPDPLVRAVQDGGRLPAALRTTGLPGPDGLRSRIVPGAEGRPPACVAQIAARGQRLGALILLRPVIEPAEIASLERSALVTALMLLSERAVTEAEHRLRGEILDDLLSSPERDPEGLRRRAALVGLDLDREHVILVARCRDGGRRRRTAQLAAGYAVRLAGLAGEHGGAAVVLLPGGTDPGEAARALAAHLREGVGVPVTVGGSSAAPGPAATGAAHREAARTLEVLLGLERDGDGACPDELGVYGLLLSRSDPAELDRFIGRAIGPVLEHDRTRGSELERTMLAWFACDGSLNRTAAALYIHVNTLYQRIDRITGLLGPQWRHGDQALQVHLALKTRRTLTGDGA